MMVKIILALLCTTLGIMYVDMALKSTTKLTRILNWLCVVLWFASAVCQILAALGF